MTLDLNNFLDGFVKTSALQNGEAFTLGFMKQAAEDFSVTLDKINQMQKVATDKVAFRKNLLINTIAQIENENIRNVMLKRASTIPHDVFVKMAETPGDMVGKDVPDWTGKTVKPSQYHNYDDTYLVGEKRMRLVNGKLVDPDDFMGNIGGWMKSDKGLNTLGAGTVAGGIGAMLFPNNPLLGGLLFGAGGMALGHLFGDKFNVAGKVKGMFSGKEKPAETTPAATTQPNANAQQQQAPATTTPPASDTPPKINDNRILSSAGKGLAASIPGLGTATSLYDAGSYIGNQLDKSTGTNIANSALNGVIGSISPALGAAKMIYDRNDTSK